MLFESIAYAQTAAPAATSASSPFGVLGNFLPIILIFVVFYFLLIRPQQKKQKQHVSMLDSLKAGDNILLNGGLYGTIISVIDTQTFQVEIASGVKVKVAKGGIATKVDPNAGVVNPIQEKK